MTRLNVEIEDTRTGDKKVRVLGEWSASFPVEIGADAACKIQLDAPDVKPRHVRYLALGHHQYIEVLDEGAVVELNGREVRSGRQRRVDSQPFMFGPFQIRFY